LGFRRSGARQRRSVSLVPALVGRYFCTNAYALYFCTNAYALQRQFPTTKHYVIICTVVRMPTVSVGIIPALPALVKQ
jgi:hypothetical protein